MTTQAKNIYGVRVVYHTAGDPKNPPIVFLHAWGARNIKRVIREFACDFYVIVPELPALLGSDTPTNPSWSYTDYVELVRALIKELNVTKPTLVGNSFGGSIATIYATLYPSDMRNLVLVDSGTSSEYPRTPYMRRYHRRFFFLLTSPTVPAFIKKFAVWYYLGKPFSRITNQELKNEIQFAQNFNREFIVDYSKIIVPTLVLSGSRDTVIHPLADARKIAHIIPNAQFYTYSGNVTTIYQKPTKIINLIKQHLFQKSATLSA